MKFDGVWFETLTFLSRSTMYIRHIIIVHIAISNVCKRYSLYGALPYMEEGALKMFILLFSVKVVLSVYHCRHAFSSITVDCEFICLLLGARWLADVGDILFFEFPLMWLIWPWLYVCMSCMSLSNVECLMELHVCMCERHLHECMLCMYGIIVMLCICTYVGVNMNISPLDIRHYYYKCKCSSISLY